MRHSLAPILMSIVLVLAGSRAAGIEVLDPKEKLNELLATKPTVTVTETYTVKETFCTEPPCSGDPWQNCQMDCREFPVTKKRQVQKHAKTENPELKLLGDVEMGKPRPGSIGDRVIARKVHAHNCVAEGAEGSPRTETGTLSLSRTDSWTTSLTRTVSDSYGVAADVKFSPMKMFGFGVKGDYRHAVSTSRGESSGNSDAIVFSHTWSQAVKPNEALSVGVTVVERDFEIPFVVRVIADGPIQANHNGKSRVSEILSEEERTFDFAGVLKTSVGSTESDSWSNTRVLSKEECEKALESGVIRSVTDVYVVEAGQMRTKLKDQIKGIRAVTGNPGDWCFTASCNYPDDGYRDICYFDDDGYCSDCFPEFDPVCLPDDPDDDDGLP